MSARFVWTDREVRRALGQPPEGGGRAEPPVREDLRYERISTDTRTVQPGDLYVALVGARFDGHDFVEQALAAGARAAVVSRDVRVGPDATLYRVDDTLVALGRLATHRRNALPARVVGITGSSGKTSTKELTTAALASSLRVHATKGNLNNRIGVPLTLLSAPEDAEVLVAEMGTNEPGEIGTLARIGRPEIGVVTTVGESHLEKLGSIQGVMTEKLSLLEGLVGDRHGVVGDQPPGLPEAARRILPDVRVAGWSEQADAALRPERPERDDRGAWSFGWSGERVRLSMPGRHAVTNALLALAVAQRLGVPAAAAAAGLASARAGWMRSETKSLGRLTLLLDCYNANPQSVLASVDVLEGWSAPRRVAVLGSMLELGSGSEALHRRVLSEVLGRSLDLVVATGAFAAAASAVDRASGAPELMAVETPAEAYARLRPVLSGDEVVLLKGSRGVALEKLIPLFEADFGGAGEAA